MSRIILVAALLLAAAPARAQTCHLSYNNGALIPNVQVVALYWGTSNNGQYGYKDQLHQYYDAVTNSPYFDWLSEYDTASYSIGRGGFAAEYADATVPEKATINESTDLEPWIGGLIDAGKVPPPDGNTLYFVHLPGTSQVSSGAGGTTCTDNCAYHYYFMHGGKEVRYAVIPDQNSGTCSTNQHCPLQLAALDRLTIVAAHELVEAVTDPNGAGWIDQNQQCGEIGDICVGQPGKAAGFTVQLEWSNKLGKCIDHDPSVVFNDFALALSPTMPTAAPGGIATVTVAAMPIAGAQPVTLALTIEQVPTGIVGSFASPSLQSNASTTLTLAVAPTMAAGSHPFTVTARATNGAHHSVTGLLTVQPGGAGGNGEGGGGNGSGGSGATGSGGNGNGGGADGVGGGRGGATHGGCSVGGAPSADTGPLALALVGAGLATASRRRRAA